MYWRIFLEHRTREVCSSLYAEILTLIGSLAAAAALRDRGDVNAVYLGGCHGCVTVVSQWRVTVVSQGRVTVVSQGRHSGVTTGRNSRCLPTRAVIVCFRALHNVHDSLPRAALHLQLRCVDGWSWKVW